MEAGDGTLKFEQRLDMKLKDEDIEKLLLEDDGETKENSLPGSSKRRSPSPPRSPVFKRKRSTRPAKANGGEKDLEKVQYNGHHERFPGSLYSSGTNPEQNTAGHSVGGFNNRLNRNDDEEVKEAEVQELSKKPKGGDIPASEDWFKRLVSPSCLANLATKEDNCESNGDAKSSDPIKKLSRVSLNRISNPPLPKSLVPREFEAFVENLSEREKHSFSGSFSALRSLVKQVKQGGLSMASSTTPVQTWQPLVRTKHHGRQSSKSYERQVAKRPLSASLEDSTETENVVIEKYISEEADEEYTPRKDDGLEWWKKGKGSSARQAKKKQKRKVSKPANKKQGNINQYFLPENEVAGIEAGVDIEKADLHERQLGISSPLIVGRCPLCDKGFAEVSQLTVHASECQDSA